MHRRVFSTCPACQFVTNLEISAGLGFLRAEEGGREAEFVVQGKYVLRAEGPGDVGISLVAGAGVSPIRQAGGRRLTDLFVYVPVTLSLVGDRLRVHPNVGWQL
jgi:hypothetical protein